MIIGIDPSFKGTGIACVLKGRYFCSSKIAVKDKRCYVVDQVFEAIDIIKAEILEFVEKCKEDNPGEKLNFIIEYPALRTPSGAYLAILMGALKEFILQTFEVESLYYLPPMACDAFVGNKLHMKSFLVNYVKEKGWVKRTISHDEATALIFCAIYSKIVKGEYPKTFFKIK